MKQVDFFKVHVNYTGKFEDYEEEDWRSKAKAKQDDGVDAFEYTDILDETQADWFDGRMWITNIYPCNKIAEVKWSEIRKENC